MAAIASPERPAASLKPWTPARGYALLLIAPAIVLAIFFIWPLAQVVIRSVTEPAIGFDNYVRIFRTSTYLRVIANTMMLAGTVAAVTLALAYPVAWMVSATRGNILYLCLGLILIPFWTSVVIRTFAWMVLFQRRGLLNSLLLSSGVIDQPLRLMHNSIGVHIGMVHILLPFMILPLLSSMRGIDPDHHACRLGAGRQSPTPVHPCLSSPHLAGRECRIAARLHLGLGLLHHPGSAWRR